MHCPQILPCSFRSVSYLLSFLICHSKVHRSVPGPGEVRESIETKMNKRKTCLTQRGLHQWDAMAWELVSPSPVTSIKQSLDAKWSKILHKELDITLTLLLKGTKYFFF